MANGWRVAGQAYRERYMPNGQFEDVVEVQVQADDGTFATLVIPQARYTRENVIALGDDWYARHQDVASIGNQ